MINKRPTVIVNFSGGKDSTAAILKALECYPKDSIILCYQDTGADYLETPSHVRQIAKMLELPLVVLQDELGFWRMVGKAGYFPTPMVRECTNRLKRQIFKKWLRLHRHEFSDEIVVVSGIRAEESMSRAKLNEWRLDEELTLKDGSSTVKLWLPCLSMSEREVKAYVASEGLPLHPCYEFSQRCSCWCCIFQPNCVVRAYAEVHPDLYEQACLMEDRIKHKWKQGFGFNDLMKQQRLF